MQGFKRKEAVAPEGPEGRPEAEKLTAWVAPEERVAVIFEVMLPPWVTLPEEGLELKLKLKTGTTASLTVTAADPVWVTPWRVTSTLAV